MKHILLALLFASLLAVLPGVSIRQDLVGAEDLSVGDRFQLNIRADVSLKGVALPDSLENFHILKVERIAKSGQLAWLQLTLAPLLPGSQSFPKLQVQLDSPDGNSYATERFRLTIIPVRAASDTVLVDIKPVARYRWQLPAWAYPLLGLLALPLLAAFFLLRKEPVVKMEETKAEPAPEPAVPLPAWKLALNQLEELEALKLLDKGEYIRHHFQLSQILRQFLERKYRFAAMEMTTSEILYMTGGIHIEKSAEVMRFLRFCDKVKFAQYLPTRTETDNYKLWLRGWLQTFEIADVHRRIASGGTHRAEVR